MHRLVVLLDDGGGGADRLEVTRAEPTLVSAVVAAVRDAEAAGRRVIGVTGGGQHALAAADLVVRLRAVSRELSEEELTSLLDLLPL